MIAYDLQCVKGHAFEGWFEDSEAYETQKKKELIACPVCNKNTVHLCDQILTDTAKNFVAGRKSEKSRQRNC
jgi:hypothetical protein